MSELVKTISSIRDRVRQARSQNLVIAFVPTMGALHAGHARLFEAARREAGFVVASIFVNPLQFDRKDDLERYPRTLEQDIRVADSAGVDVVFAPDAAELYPRDQLTFVDSPTLSRFLCGEFRPGHFRGVATVVLKLLNIVQPDRAYFGQKDAQQLAVIQRMASDLNLPVAIVPVETVREADGLALSSRNAGLRPEQRAVAPALYRALIAARHALETGERSPAAVRERALHLLNAYPEVRVEYFEFSDIETLMPLETIEGRVLIAAAVWLGNTRLIDNITWSSEN